jgi:hypothetical protein
MQELKLSKGVVKVIWEGTEYLLRKPTLGRALELERQVQSSSGKEVSELQNVMDFLIESGLPRDVLLELDVEALEQVFLALMPSKKK